MADSDNTPPSDGPRGKPKPPPGVSDVTHQPIRRGFPDTVRAMKEDAHTRGLNTSPEHVCIVVAPDIAAELYRWAWQVIEPGCRAFAWDPRVRPVSAYMQDELIGEVLGYPVVCKAIQDEGCSQFVPYQQLAAWQQAQEAVAEGKRCRQR